MSDFIYNEDGTLTHLNGRVANGIRINDVRTLSEIQSATSFEPSDVASASALKGAIEHYTDISQSEKIVGTWDGKTRYGKIIKGYFNPTSGQNQLIATISGITKIVFYSGFVSFANGNSSPMSYMSEGAYSLVYAQNGGVYARTNTPSLAGQPVELYIEYIKE